MVKGKGLEYWLLNGGGPAIKAYENDIRDDAFYTALEYWLWSLYDPGLSDQAKRRLGVCNQAFVRYLTQLKVRHPGIKIEDNDKIGIPGVRTIHLDAMVGTATMDMIVHRSISELYNNRYQPYCMALTWPMIQPYVLEPDSLFTNIQETDFTGYKDEFRHGATYYTMRQHHTMDYFIRQNLCLCHKRYALEFNPAAYSTAGNFDNNKEYEVG